MGADDERRRRGPPAGDAGAATGADPPPDPAPLDASEGGFSEPDAAPMPAAALPPADAARYQVGAFLGRGGMGVVHTARDLHLARDVALKALPADAAGAAAAARLLREARITARLDHPGVLAVHDVGALPDGRAFYTMRLVRGRSLAQALRADEVAPARDLVRHVLAACEAVGYAHAVGLVHRDLKPANVLIGPHGETQVADWGLAAPTPAAAPRWVDLPGPRPAAGGTPGFVAPEQARGAPPDPRHDVWSLGAVLAQVAPPADAPLAAIIQRAQAPDPDQRYADAGALAADLARWFEGRRVMALRYGPLDWARWAWRAWRVPLLVAGAGALLIAGAVAAGWWQTARARDRALAAEDRAATALRTLRRDAAVRAAEAGDRARALALAAEVLRDGPDAVALGVRAAFGRQPGAALLTERAAPDCAWAARAPAGALVCGQPDGVRLLGPDDAPRWRTPGFAEGGVVRAAAGVVQVWDDRYQTRLLDLATGALRQHLPFVDGDWLPHAPPRRPGGRDGLVDPATLPPSGCALRIKVVAVADDGEVAALCEDGRLLRARPGEPVTRSTATPLTGEHVGASLAWLPDGRLVAGSLRGRLVRFDRDGAAERVVPTARGSVTRLVASADGRWVAAAGTAPGVALWQMGPSTVAEVIGADHGRPLDFGFVGDDRLEIVGARRVTYRLPGAAPRAVQASAGLSSGAALAGGAALLLAGGDGWVHRVDLRTGAVGGLRLGGGVVKAVGAGPWGPWAAGMAAPHLVRLTDDGPVPFAGPRRLRRGLALPDGTFVGIDVHAGLFRWTAPDRPPARLGEGPFADLAADGPGWLTLDRAGTLTRWRVGAPPTEVGLEPGAQALAASGARVAVAGRGRVRWWDADARGELPQPGAAPVLALALDAAGARLAAGDALGGVFVFDLPAGALRAVLPGHTERVVDLAFLPDGDLLSVSWDGTARLWAMGDHAR